jgi:hypothetical protein
MSVNATFTPTPPPESFLSSFTLSEILFIITAAAVALAVERIISYYLSRLAKRARIDPNTTNTLVLVTRILILIFAIAFIARVGGLGTEWILSLSALGGAALGFASQKTLGNFIAGLFLLSARPFKVGDYVRLGAVEGLVQEITINYTKVQTMANNIVSVSNLQILDRDITNFAYEKEKVGRTPGIFCYTFEIGFDHVVSAKKLSEIFESVFNSRLFELPKKPVSTLIRSDAFARIYLVYLYVRKPEDIFKYRSWLAEEVYRRWDEERNRLKSPA